MHIPHRRSWNAMPGLASPIQGRPSDAGRLLRLARQLQHLALRWRRTRTEEAELAAMDNRMLADIGMSRCEVARYARRGWGA